MDTQAKAKRSFFSVAKECLSVWWTFHRGKDIRLANGGEFNENLSQRSRLFYRIGELVFFKPSDMGCTWDFHVVPGDRWLTAGGWYDDVAIRKIYDNQVRVRVRELLSKKAAKWGVVVVLLGALIAPFTVQHMTPIHPFAGFTTSHRF